jgi:hypothetical protein
MKKALALPLALVAVVLGASSCSGGQKLSPVPEISMTRAPIDSSAAQERADVALVFQSVLRAVHDEGHAAGAELDDLDYEELVEKYPRTMKGIEESSVGREATEKFIREYSKYLTEAPRGTHMGVNQKDVSPPQYNTMKITGTDLFLSYWEERKVITHEGVSMHSRDTLNDVFTMTKINGAWKITGITF